MKLHIIATRTKTQNHLEICRSHQSPNQLHFGYWWTKKQLGDVTNNNTICVFKPKKIKTK